MRLLQKSHHVGLSADCGAPKSFQQSVILYRFGLGESPYPSLPCSRNRRVAKWNDQPPDVAVAMCQNPLEILIS